MTGSGMGCPGESESWWAVFTRHQHEKSAAEMLRSRKLEVFLPLYSSRRQWKDRKKVLLLPLFPGYLFVRAHRGGTLPILTVPGVISVVRHGNEPALISNQEIAAIERAVLAPEPPEPVPFLMEGDRVRVTRGPLRGMEGILLRGENTCRLVISVSLLSQSAALVVSATDVESTECYMARRCGAHFGTESSFARLANAAA